MSYFRLVYVCEGTDMYENMAKTIPNIVCSLKRFYSWNNYPMDKVAKEKPLKSEP